MEMVSCSIIIVNWKSIDFLRSCLQSLKNKTTCSLEIIVIDNNSDLEEQTKLQQLTDINLIINNENHGFAAANNQGFQIARGKYIFMLNPDTVILNTAIDSMVDFMDDHSNIYAVGPTLYYSEKLDYHPSVLPLETPFSNLLKTLPLSSTIINIKNKLLFNRNKIQQVDCLVGAAILFRRSVFEKIGNLDEQFFIYSEEIDFCNRMKIAGLPIYYYPKAELIHYGGKSQSKSSVAKYRYIWTSKVKYFDKYFSNINITINFIMLLIVLKIKYTMFLKKELQPIINIIIKRLNQPKVDT